MKSIFCQYLQGLGGVCHIIISPYFLVSVVLTILCSRYLDADHLFPIVLDVAPALLGIVLASFAIVVGFGDELFRKFLADGSSGLENEKSDYEEKYVDDKMSKFSILWVVASTFFHYILVTFISLILVVVGYGFHGGEMIISSFDGYWKEVLLRLVFLFKLVSAFFFLYSVTLILAMGLAILRLTKWYQMDVASRKQDGRTCD